MSTTRDLPQASSLETVRALLAAIAAGSDRDLRTAGEVAGLSPRHAHYYGTAAIDTLGLARLEGERLCITALGRALLATRARSLAERSVLARAIADSESITSIAPDLLDPDGPTAEALTHRLIHAGLSPATARRRASTLLSWRRYVLDRQTTLALATERAPPRRRSKPR